MEQVAAVIRGVLAAFGPLIVFWGLDLTYGLKLAIASTVIFMIGDAAWRLWRGLPFTKLYLLVGGLTVVFGGIDLVSATPFMLQYEAVITNIVTGVAFIMGARGKRSIILELAEQQNGGPFVNRPDLIRFFQFGTLVWALYFFAKAAVYLALARSMTMQHAMAARQVIGLVSVAAMLGLSITQGERLFALCKRLRLLPEPDPALDPLHEAAEGTDGQALAVALPLSETNA